MLPNLEIINPLKIKNWDQILLANDESTIFHSSAWARVLSESYNYIPKYVTFINKNKLEVLIPVMEISSYITGKRGISLPFSDYCDPIIKEGISIKNILEYLINSGKQFHWRYLELRTKNYPISDINQSSFFYGHILKLKQDNDYIFSTFSSSTKRNIKKAEREGVIIKISDSLQALKKYYNFHCLTRKRHGIPPQPFNFFKKIYDYIISKGHGFTIMANIDQMPIAGAVFFHYRDQAMYKFGASDLNYQNYRPNNLIMWEAIKWYTKNDYNSFCFGRTEPENEGLRRFKSGWGTEEKIYSYYKYNIKNEMFEKQETLLNSKSNYFFKLMPISVLKVVGSYLYKHVG